jgi:hypothetical protein
MRQAATAVALGAIVLGGCTLWQSLDRFAGRYRVADPKDRTEVRIMATGVGRWDMRYGARDPMPGSELVAANKRELVAWFGDGVSLETVHCLATKGARAHPVICSVPRHVPIKLERHSVSSRTGWILVAPTAAGLVAGDLERQD